MNRTKMQLMTHTPKVCTPAMSNHNCLLSQKLCHYLNQGHTLNDILMRTAYLMTYFDLSKLKLVQTNLFKAFES